MSVPSVSLVPQPQRAVWTGDEWLLPKHLTLARGAVFPNAARYLMERLERAAGGCFEEVSEIKSNKFKFNFSYIDGLPESYRLTISRDVVTFEAADAAGALYAVITFLQLMPPAIWGDGPRVGVRWAVPCGEIEDAPRFRWRGLMLDSARSFQTVAEIRRWIELMAQHKLNRFHWHLTDNQGWRVEIKRYPELTRVGAWRGGTQKGHALAGGDSDGVRYGGFYTQEEIREIVAYAESLSVCVIPEIDLPGHTQAAIAAYPWLGIGDTPCRVGERWIGNHGPQALVVPTDEAIAFFCDVFDEVVELFPSAYIHLGGDEVPAEIWHSSSVAREETRRLGLTGAEALYGHFVSRIANHLKSRGRIPMGWDEAGDSPCCPEEMALHVWHGHATALRAVRKGHPVVMASCYATYFDYYQSLEIEMEPLGNRDIDVPYLDIDRVYSYEPIPIMFTPDEEARVLGVQGQLWSEYLRDFSSVEYMTYPRACALAEVAWCPKGKRDIRDFRHRLDHHLRRLRCQRVGYRALS